MSVNNINVDEIINQINLPNNGLMHASNLLIKETQLLLHPVILNEKVIKFILSIRQQNLRDSLCVMFFNTISNNDNEIKKDLYLRVLNILLASPDANELYNVVFNKIDQIFDNSNDPDIKAEATDIMLNYYPKRGERLLNILRQQPDQQLRIDLERPALHYDTDIFDEQQGESLLTEIRNSVINLKPTEKLIYDDRENVHNKTINSSIVSTCRSLINMMISSVTFDDKYKIMVFNGDTIETVKIKLADILSKVLNKDIIVDNLKIYGDNEKEQLQNRMTFKIKESENEKKIIKIGRNFKQEDKYLYKTAMNSNEFVCPERLKSIERNDESKIVNVLEEIFIATNTWLEYISENYPEDLELYLSITNVKDANIIWLNREEIKNELNLVIECCEVENFVNKIKNNLFPLDNLKNDIFEKIKIGTLLEMDLHEILNAVWKFIQQSEYKIEIIKRLREELEDGSGICCSGIAARLINSIQGFFDESKYPSLKIKISIDDEMKSKINKIISDVAIKNEIDPLYDSIKFKQIVNETIKTNSKLIMDEFTEEEIFRNGINEDNILRLTYELYQLD